MRNALLNMNAIIANHRHTANLYLKLSHKVR